jgi:hypothetical protein
MRLKALALIDLKNVNKRSDIVKLHKFIDNLNKLVEENPKAKDFDVIYSIDDEGNAFDNVYFSPTIGNLSNDQFRTQDYIEELIEEYPDENLENLENLEVNSVCIN